MAGDTVVMAGCGTVVTTGDGTVVTAGGVVAVTITGSVVVTGGDAGGTAGCCSGAEQPAIAARMMTIGITIEPR